MTINTGKNMSTEDLIRISASGIVDSLLDSLVLICR
ncbi:MAG: hypothetical protein RLZZ349_1074, partial [Pseudomonadota bacterium]